MSIHQVSVAYQADQDRLLLRVRTREEQLFELWLTRRLMVRLWQPLQATATALAVGSVSSSATVMPEAREMMTQTMRERSNRAADFRSPFEETARERPLGEEPMLVAAIDIKRLPDRQVEVVWRDSAQRQLSMNLSPDLLNNLLTLLEKALQKSEWGVTPAAPAPAASASAAPTTAPPRVLN
jgi:hypothetical protein